MLLIGGYSCNFIYLLKKITSRPYCQLTDKVTYNTLQLFYLIYCFHTFIYSFHLFFSLLSILVITFPSVTNACITGYNTAQMSNIHTYAFSMSVHLHNLTPNAWWLQYGMPSSPMGNKALCKSQEDDCVIHASKNACLSPLIENTAA